MSTRPSPVRVDVPAGYPTATIFLDESGTKASGGGFFVVAGVKVRNPGAFLRMVRDVRDKTGFTGELKFSGINRGSFSTYCELIDRMAETEAHYVATIVDRSAFNPFRPGEPEWVTHANIAAQLLRGCINRVELVSVLMDAISTPVGSSVEDRVRMTVNRRFKATSVVSAVSLDSKTCDGLQIADLVAGSIANERRRERSGEGSGTSQKARIAARLKAALGLDTFEDQRQSKVNIYTLREASRTPRSLTVVKDLA